MPQSWCEYQSLSQLPAAGRGYWRQELHSGHQSADAAVWATAIIRGGYEYQGQKCSAASRIFVPASLWAALKTILCACYNQVRRRS
ncbi:aldehyde dehydrogenase family protein [Bradyrhizobium zhanjiangense]|uniref:Aldehyde dehydrogenase family protein n=1 Tax=Bradyrhizobium zhanjiangense TaxID=1325107 RepID=A0ABY0D9Q4_9BRAD|nr:aldehyde dehydrogenase family protein [Bradyrhizobium zhanjiangense]